MADQSIIRITKEISEIQKNSDLSLAVAFRDRDVRNVKAMIIGPHETPYEFGFFEFAFKFNKEYPRKAPAVTCNTTNGGRCRFNPNIYASGKVCLSILGTWRGEPGEEWSPAQGLESILISIQSLMSSNPYENEPGFEEANQPSDKTFQKQYVAKIRHETLRISVIQKLESFLNLSLNGDMAATPVEYDPEADELDMDDTSIPWEPFRDLYKRRFLWYYDTYLEAIKQAKKDVKDNQSFTRMPFEGGSNSMDGKFNYTELEKRLGNIKAALDAEPAKWAAEGMSSKTKGTTVPVNLARQFDQIKESFKRGDIAHNIELENGNPFSWILTYFGRPMTNFDGGMFKIKLSFSPRFPEEQPRVKFQTPVFHHRVTPDGLLCYLPNPHRYDDVRQHIEAVIHALEEENPPYDPRTQVHPEAHKLYWGSADDRKVYNRKLRRSVQRSMEDF
ncbi:ubiquitin-conjugating enzyme/RWD-like protein [Nemania sp. FL0916]|nr:ubiquitin-conjugating enzyme/RWD-like protein [Nemania sp. FL0916]